MSAPWPASSPGRGGWLLLVLALAMAGGAGGGHPPAARHPYMVPSCTGLAQIPGYTHHCK